MEEMSTISHQHTAVSALQSHAHSAVDASGVDRLVGLLNKVLSRLQRQIARRSKRMAHQAKGCKIVRQSSVVILKI